MRWIAGMSDGRILLRKIYVDEGFDICECEL